MSFDCISNGEAPVYHARRESPRQKAEPIVSSAAHTDSYGAAADKELLMVMSQEARVVAGITILTIPTIMYGGVTLLGILTHGVVGLSPGSMALRSEEH